MKILTKKAKPKRKRIICPKCGTVLELEKKDFIPEDKVAFIECPDCETTMLIKAPKDIYK